MGVSAVYRIKLAEGSMQGRRLEWPVAGRVRADMWGNELLTVHDAGASREPVGMCAGYR